VSANLARLLCAKPERVSAEEEEAVRNVSFLRVFMLQIEKTT